MLKKIVEKKWQCASLSVMSASSGSGSLPNFARDRVRELLGRRLAAEIGRARFPRGDDAFDGVDHPVVQVTAAEMVQHEGAGRGLFTLTELLQHDRITPWDVYALMLHARQATIFKKPVPRPKDALAAEPLLGGAAR